MTRPPSEESTRRLAEAPAPLPEGILPVARLRAAAADLLSRRTLMGSLFVIVLGLLLFPRGPSVPVISEGGIADRDVLAPIEFQVIDEAATHREREKRRDEVPYAFDDDRRPGEEAIATVRTLFEEGRAAQRAIAVFQLARSDDVALGGARTVPVDPALLVLYLAPGTARKTPRAALSTLAASGFDAAHEESLSRVMRDVLGKRIATEDLDPFRGRGIVARDTATGEEEKVRSIDEVITPEKARRALAAELAQESDLWDRSARAALEDYVAGFCKSNFAYNVARHQERQRAAMELVKPLSVQVTKGEKIVDRGQRVGPAEALKLRALAERMEGDWSGLKALGIALLLAIFAYGLKRYVDYHQTSEKRIPNLYGMVVLAFLSSAFAVSATLYISASVAGQLSTAPYNNLEAYLFLAPYGVGSLLLTLLVDSEIAMVFAVSFSLIAGLLSSTYGDYTTALYALISGFGAIYLTGPYLRRTAVLASGVAIGVTASVAVLGVALHRGTWRDVPLLLFSVLCAFLSGVLAAIVAQVLLPLFESLFGILTDLKLAELMNANHPLLAELALRAPGTYNHSMVVGLLAESAAKAIGVNPLFMRAAAYYHDVGKMKMPEYFIENQRPGDNKHDKLAPSLSALIVKSHVKEGIEMARSHGLPEELIEMIPAHHGTRLLAYFYRKAKDLEDGNLSPVTEEDYRYPGPKPRSKAGGIMMLTDAVEAASRSLKEPTSQKFRSVIDKMSETIYLDGQLDETDLTIKDIQLIRDAFHKVLLSHYHQRIKYPGFDFEKGDGKKTTPRPPEPSGH